MLINVTITEEFHPTMKVGLSVGQVVQVEGELSDDNTDTYIIPHWPGRADNGPMSIDAKDVTVCDKGVGVE